MTKQRQNFLRALASRYAETILDVLDDQDIRRGLLDDLYCILEREGIVRQKHERVGADFRTRLVNEIIRRRKKV